MSRVRVPSPALHANRSTTRPPVPGTGGRVAFGRGARHAPGDALIPAFSPQEDPMAKCEVCGNDYYLAFQVVTAGVTHTFDSFECAIHRLAPICANCGCKVIGHGIEANGTFYCCAHCAHAQVATSIVDND